MRLRWLEASDADDLFEVFGDPEVMRYWSTPAYAERAEAESLIEDIHQRASEGTLFQWGIERTSDPGVIGTVTLASIDRAQGRCEVGFILGRQHWGKGLATAALTVLFDHAFGELGMRRIEADVDPRNEPSLRRLESLGFEREGYLRERWTIGGEVQDTVLLGLLARDWLTR